MQSIPIPVTEMLKYSNEVFTLIGRIDAWNKLNANDKISPKNTFFFSD